ncbi:hypothetical protein ACWCPD_26360 [Streptomyces sp. NPDC001935]
MNGVAGVIGIDPQHLRTTVVLREGEGTAARLAPVGDGVRRSIPNAADAQGRWGSEAAEHRLAGVRPTDADGELYGWRCEAWSPEFRAGLHRRLTRYLGEVEPVPLHGYRTCVAVPPLGQAGTDPCWPETEPVGPTDALVCRWLTAGPDAREVVAVAVGDTWTLTGAYRVRDTADGPHVTRVGTLRETEGTAAWRGTLLRRVLDRCPPAVLGQRILSALDGVDEFATGLRTGDQDRQVTWSGPLADVLYTPLKMTPRQFMAGAETGPATAGLVLAVQRAVRDLGAGAEEGPLIVVGGPGSLWPLRSVLPSRLGTMWQSTDPGLDLAYGASWWPSLRGRFAGKHGGRVRAVPAVGGGGGPNAAEGLGSAAGPDSPEDSFGLAGSASSGPASSGPANSGPGVPGHGSGSTGGPEGLTLPGSDSYDEIPPWRRP